MSPSGRFDLKGIRNVIVFEILDFTRFGGDLLSHALRRSTIGAKALNFRVRDGTGCFALAMTTKPRKIQDRSSCEARGRAAGRVFALANARCRTSVVSPRVSVFTSDIGRNNRQRCPCHVVLIWFLAVYY